jgi:cytoskeletal protein CcmA (bactofilin family)
MWPWTRRSAVSSRKKLTAFLDEGSEIEGKYTFSGTVLLNGKFQGEIASPDTLIIGERGVVNATVRAGTLVVNGELVGDVHASERVELAGRARVFGDLESPVLVLEEGVIFEGRCRMPKPDAVDALGDGAVVPLKRS